MNSKSDRSINVSAKNVFDVLHLILPSEKPIGVLEISRKLSLPPSSVHRALVSLEESRFVARGLDMSKYVAGPMIHHVLRAMLNRYSVSRESYRYLNDIASSTGQTTSVFVRLGWYTLLVATVEGPDEVCHARSAGETMLLHETPAGIAILGSLTRDEVSAYRKFVGAKMPEHLDEASSRKTSNLIAEARSSDFVIKILREEQKRRVMAFPLKKSNGSVISSLGISGPVPEDGTSTELKPDSGLLQLIGKLEQSLEQDLNEKGMPFEHVNPDAIVLKTHQSRI